MGKAGLIMNGIAQGAGGVNNAMDVLGGKGPGDNPLQAIIAALGNSGQRQPQSGDGTLNPSGSLGGSLEDMPNTPGKFTQGMNNNGMSDGGSLSLTKPRGGGLSQAGSMFNLRKGL